MYISACTCDVEMCWYHHFIWHDLWMFVLSLDRACKKSLQCFTLHQVYPGPLFHSSWQHKWMEVLWRLRFGTVHSGPRHPNSHPKGNSSQKFVGSLFWVVPHHFNNHPSVIEWFLRFFDLFLKSVLLAQTTVPTTSWADHCYRSWGASHENLVRSSSAMLPLRRRGDCQMRKWNRFRLRVIYARHGMTKMWINRNCTWKIPMRKL